MKRKTTVELVKFVILISTVALAISCPTLFSPEVSDHVRLSKEMTKQFNKDLQSKCNKEVPKVGKTNAGMDETLAKEKVSSFIGCDLPKSAKNVKFHSEGFLGVGIVLIKFDIPLSDLKALLRKTDKIPDFAVFKKDLQKQNV